ncbi:TPM domain-containing protein [bacterium]|nr:TPM domain-containing protein [bacterium]
MIRLINLTRKYFGLSLVILILLVPCESFAAGKYPTWRGAVNDFAKFIDSASVSKMEMLAREVLQKPGTAIIVATVAEIGENEDINVYVNGLYKAWGIGKKGTEKGGLIFLTLKWKINSSVDMI